MLSKLSKRNHAAYALETKRLYEKFCVKQEEIMEDYLDDLYNSYAFNHDQNSRDSLAYVVMRQLRYVLYQIKDQNHMMFLEMEKNNIDWLAQPYFRGQDLRLSTLLTEYRYLYAHPTHTPTRACHDMFRLNVEESANPDGSESKTARIEE